MDEAKSLLLQPFIVLIAGNYCVFSEFVILVY